MAKARGLCRKLLPRSVDLLCFPEMAFTGYVFENAAAISPHLERPRTGATSLFCAELAQKLQCYVIAGYPEELASDEPRLNEEIVDGPAQDNAEGSASSEVHQVGANSAIMYGPNGQWVGGYRKTNLFETDKPWAKAGTGFATFDLPPPLGTMSLAICMDLNPHPPNEWTSIEGPYELADYCLSKRANVLILLDAWLDSGNEPDDKHDWHTLRYWSARLRPLWASDENTLVDSDGEDREETLDKPDAQDAPSDEMIVVACNRCGEENGKLFAGTSAIFSMVKGSGRPKLLDMMERDEEGVRIWDINV